ncbi:glycerol-3-phosphate dehydrogenase/oxidase [Williamsia sp. CHRR-6]|uniref:glycerol-3-phosphate dehydrogenase/oxidase n=1 Tax=Williamsia sp. CHRR-6 TaxID=2835871 RepID=UPI001BDB0BA7|nr:glycerol-3-phosphate dehydrogenase/oxidase [Williamsia sp. CHRR-6]MBT0567766.1 glycerol-3-phosphate dehydrogenase/oxidase [Williamsia sp. CHRR-6]
MGPDLSPARIRADADVLRTRRAAWDVLVIGGGITGVGVALDAASRGLSVALVEAHDLGFGTSRWSSKLVHGGLRYLASARVQIAWESAHERHHLMTTIAPHLISPMAQLVPHHAAAADDDWRDRLSVTAGSALVGAGFAVGDLLRRSAGTPSSTLASPSRVGPGEVLAACPTVTAEGLRGGWLAYDGQLIDDARLVVAVARTAAAHGALILPRHRAQEVTGRGARITDTRDGTTFSVSARAVINATGVWAATVDDSIAMRPSRGTHLVIDAAAMGNPTAALTVPVRGSRSRFVFALPAQLGRVYVGLTDVEAPGPIPDVARGTEDEIDHILDTINQTLIRPLTRADVRGTFAGLRPLLDQEPRGRRRSTAEASRDHTVSVNSDGVITVVGGKLTTYRMMARDAVDAAVRLRSLAAYPCVTDAIPLVGARGPAQTGRVLPASLVARYGAEAARVVEQATVSSPLSPIAPGIDVTRAEIEFAVTCEGALDTDDVLHRRTRIGLVDADAEAARPAITHIVDQAGAAFAG